MPWLRVDYSLHWCGGTGCTGHHRHAQLLYRISIRLRKLGQQVADEHTEILVQLPLRLRSNRIKHDRRLARTRYTRKNVDLPFRQLQVNVFEVVLPRAAYVYVFLVLHMVGVKFFEGMQFKDFEVTNDKENIVKQEKYRFNQKQYRLFARVENECLTGLLLSNVK